METNRKKMLKWTMVIVLVTHLLCFFPNEMIPLPVIIVEIQLAENFLEWKSPYDFISNFIIAGQITAIIFLMMRFTKTAWITGLVSIVMLISGNIFWLIEKNVSVTSFEFLTSIPFIGSSIAFCILGFRKRKVKTTDLLSFRQS